MKKFIVLGVLASAFVATAAIADDSAMTGPSQTPTSSKSTTTVPDSNSPTGVAQQSSTTNTNTTTDANGNTNTAQSSSTTPVTSGQ
jgi:hypothetical protein